MSLTTVAELRSALGIGSLYTDAQLQEVCNAADDIILPMLWNNYYYATEHSNSGNVGTLYFSSPVFDIFYIGQTVTITGASSHFNGNKTITAVGEYSISFATNNEPDAPRHPLQPYARVAGDATADYSTISAVQTAALLISIDIWQARQTSSTSAVSPDFGVLPYKMGNNLTARVRGLLAPYLSPSGMVG